ncbi:DUF234 domain-containing protein [Nocardia sp. NBC_01377]|uniref:ATP-binding protein n=1 Tax=Nocardia sp. NBC_01377 TaxID=2903595 RepID=UPI003252F987
MPDNAPSIVVLDEIPWLIEQDSAFEGALQTVWDRHLSDKPVLLLLVGSDISVMESLGTRERPFFGRATKMTVEPLHLADVQSLTELDAADSIDALLITGGFPEIVKSWRPGMSRIDFLRDATSNPLAPLLVAGELSLLGEFPEGARSRAILEAIGSGERTFSTIAAEAGGANALAAGTLNPLLNTLQAKRIVDADLPLSTKPDTKNKRYRISDSYLRFWLAFLRRGIPLIERGRGDVAMARIERSWTAWRGRAIEPVVRESLLRLLPDERWPDTEAVGGWWNRQNNPEIDLIGADRGPVARTIHFAGSIKWLEDRAFDRHDYDALIRGLLAIPGTAIDTPLVAVSRSGVADNVPLATHWGPEDLVRAWRR